MEDYKDLAKLAVAAGISIPAAKLLMKKYKEAKIKRKYQNKRDTRYSSPDQNFDYYDDLVDTLGNRVR